MLTGLAVLAAWLVRRRRDEEAYTEPGVDPSAELRRRLDEARRREDDAGSTEASGAEATPDDVDARRRDVHDRAHAAADEMRDSVD